MVLLKSICVFPWSLGDNQKKKYIYMTAKLGGARAHWKRAGRLCLSVDVPRVSLLPHGMYYVREYAMKIYKDIRYFNEHQLRRSCTRQERTPMVAVALTIYL